MMKKRKFFTTSLLTILLLGFFTTNAMSYTICSTFKSDGIFADWNGWYIGEGNTPSFSFTPSADGLLGSIDLAIFYHSGYNLFDLELRSDSNGQPGSVIESFDFAASRAENLQVVSQYSILNPFLSTNSQYWLTASSALGFLEWEYADPNFLFSQDKTPAYRLNAVAPVPEASTFLLFGIGLAGLACWRKKRDC